MARHVLFTSQKGGVGKSTLARSTAVALACAGRKVLLADFDVEQRTCLRWQAQRQARALEPAITVAKFSKEAKLDRVCDEYDDVVIDTRGQHEHEDGQAQHRDHALHVVEAVDKGEQSLPPREPVASGRRRGDS